MKLLSLIVSTSVAVFILTACEKRIDPGPTVTITKSLSEFHELEVYGSISVEIVEGMSNDIHITAPENLMEYIDTYVFSERLTIRERNNPIRQSDIHIEMSETSLAYIYLNGSGIITGDTVRASNLALRLVGSGEMDLIVDCNKLNSRLIGSGRMFSSGIADELEAWLDGSGMLDYKSIETRNVEAKLEGSGMMEVQAIDSIFARVSGSGLIRYWGSPNAVDAQVDGSGRIIKMD